MRLDPYYAGMLQELSGLDLDTIGTDIRVTRRVLQVIARKPPWQAPPGIDIVDRELPGPHGPVPVRTYRPRERVTAALLWMHGGGFTGGDLEMRESHMVAAELASRASVLVVTVAYRLAGGPVRFPVPLDDVAAAWSWLTGRDGPAGLRTFALGGASAGAALALATAMRERDRGRRPAGALLLAYPFVHHPAPHPEGELAGRISGLPAPARFPPEYVAGIVRDYVGRTDDVPVHAMPGAGRMDGLPGTSIVISEFDGLRPSAELLQLQLRSAGVPVSAFLARGMLHGHLDAACSIPAVDASLEFFAAALTSAARAAPVE